MDIVIFGAGITGRFLAETLAKEKHNVTLIDSDPKKLNELSPNTDVASLCITSINWKVLKELNQRNEAIFLGVSQNDGENLASCAIAKALNYKKTLARVGEKTLLDDSELDFKKIFQVDYLFAPEIIVSEELFKRITNPKAQILESFANGKLQIETHIIKKDWKYIDKPLSELEFKNLYLVTCIKRQEKENQDLPHIVFPRGDTRIYEGDEVTFLGKTDDMLKLNKILDIETQKVKSVVLCGASSYQRLLAQNLHENNISVKIIESNLKDCEDLSKELTFATILNHKETDKEFLIEENIASVDVFVSSSNSTDKNLITATLAEDIGCKNVITLVSDDAFSHLLSKLGITYVLSEKFSIANIIFSIIHGEVISSMSTLYQNQIKVIEVAITDSSPLKGKSIQDIAHKLPKNCVLGYILKDDGTVSLAKGPEILHPGYFIMAFISPNQIESFYKLL